MRKRLQKGKSNAIDLSIFLSARNAAEKWEIPYRAVKLLCAYDHITEKEEIEVRGKKAYYIKKDREPPTEEELFRVGYNYPKHSMPV